MPRCTSGPNCHGHSLHCISPEHHQLHVVHPSSCRNPLHCPAALPSAWPRQISASQDPHSGAASPPPCLHRVVLGSSLHSAGSAARWMWMDLQPAAGRAVASS
uniref:Uncharacterized protein n=1 Tax=Arundo donax TaxID=35708 RepID=A0A0A9FE11_ARUDO